MNVLRHTQITEKIIIVFLLCIMPMSSPAMTREEAVQYALKNSESIRMIKESATALKAEANQATAFTKPQFTLNGAYTEMGDNAPENPYIPSYDRNISTDIRISQMLYAGGRIRKSRELGKNFYQQAELLEISGERDIRKQTRMAFDAVLYRQAALDILKDRVRQRQMELEDAHDLRDAGMVTSLDVRQANLSLNMAEDALKSGEASYQEALIDFNLAIGRNNNEAHLMPEGSLENVPELKAILQQLETARSQGEFLDMKSVRTQADAARFSYEIAKGERLPELVLVSGAESAGEKPGDMNESWYVGVQVSWNVFDGGLVRAKTIAERANMKKAGEALRKTQKELAGEVGKITVNIRSLAERIVLQREAAELSRQNYEDARGHYRAGTITLTRLGEFNLSYAEARFNLLSLFFLQREQIVLAEALLEK